MARKYMRVAPLRPRPNDKVSAHRERVLSMRAAGYSFKNIGLEIGASHVAVWKRWHQWNGTLGTSKDAVKRLACPHCGGFLNDPVKAKEKT